MRLFHLVLSLLVFCIVACSQTLDNATIVKLVKAGIGDDTIVGMVNQQPGKYSLSADDVIALKKAGVSEKIMSAMIARNPANPASPAPTGSAAVASGQSDPAPADAELRPCFIVKRKGILGRTKYDFVDGVNVAGAKLAYKGEEIESMQSSGARVIVLESKHTPEEVDSARRACRNDGSVHAQNSAKGSNAGQSQPLNNNSLIDFSFVSTPPNALVFIGGMAIGRTPFTTKLPPNTYKATFSAESYPSLTQDFTVAPGYPTTLSATLPTGSHR